MKTGTEALSSRLLSGDLPPTLIVPMGEAWPQSRSDVAKHPELELLGTRRGAAIERRLVDIVATARQRDVPDVTILLIAEALNVAQHPDYIVRRLSALADSLTVVFFARHQVPALTSVVAHRIQSWTSPQFVDRDFSAVLSEAKKRFHYDQYLQKWSGEGHETIAIPYLEEDRRTDDLLSRFSRVTGIPVPGVNPEQLKNSSLGATQLTRLGQLKAQLSWMRRFPVLRGLAARIFYQARKRIQSEPVSTRWVLSAAEKRQVIELYRESNALFKKLLGSSARRTDWKQWFATVETRTKQ
jgi:hypothetical protein